MKILVLDTETLGVSNRLVYNLGYIIFDTDGMNVIKERDYVIKQVYDNEKYMQSAYYGWKKPIYEQMLADGLVKKVYWNYALKVLLNDILRCLADGSELYAYNSRFDFSAIKETCKRYKCENQVNPAADGIKDIMDYIKPITDGKDYKEFCEKNNYLTPTGKLSRTAETLFRFLNGDTDFEEKHMALDDSRIELQILLKALGLDYQI